MIEVSTAERRDRSARPCPLPPASQLHRFLSQPDYTDSFEIAASPGGMSILEIYVALLGHIPGAFKHLLVLRSLVVRPFGIGGVTYGDLTAPPTQGVSTRQVTRSVDGHCTLRRAMKSSPVATTSISIFGFPSFEIGRPHAKGSCCRPAPKSTTLSDERTCRPSFPSIGLAFRNYWFGPREQAALALQTLPADRVAQPHNPLRPRPGDIRRAREL